MKRHIKKENSEILARCNDPKELGEEALTPEELGWCRQHQDELFGSLGLKDPNSRSAGLPRIFVLGYDEQGEPKVHDLSSVDIRAGSDEFWRQVQLGNVFAYPAEADDPVQLQVGLTEQDSPVLGVSKPVTAETMPPAPKHERSLWQRFASWFGFYKKETNMELNQAQEQKKLADKLEIMQKVRKVNKKDAEAEEKRQVEAERAEKEKQAKLQKLAAARDVTKKGMRQMADVFHPQPRFDPNIEKKERKEGLYTKKQFSDLKVYKKTEIDLEQIRLGEKGKPLTDEEFAAVAAAALWDPKNAMRGYNQMNPDRHGEKSLEGMGFSKEEAPRLLTARNRSWWTTDLFIVPPRDNEGSYFKDVTNYGRKDAVEAFQAYQKGDKSKLAGLIAEGVNSAADDVKMEEGDQTPQMRGAIEIGAKLADLMKKDPELKELALQQGMKKENLKIAEGMKEFSKLSQEARNAEYEIAKAKLEGRELSGEEKAKYAKAMVMSRLALSRLAVDNAKESPEAEEKMTVMAMNSQPASKLDLDKWNKDPSKRPAPPKGKMWMDTMQACAGSVYKLYRPAPASLGQLSSKKGMQALEQVADEIVRQEGLAEKSTDWLANEAAAPTLDMGQATAKAMQVLAPQKQGALGQPQPGAPQEIKKGEEPEPEQAQVL